MSIKKLLEKFLFGAFTGGLATVPTSPDVEQTIYGALIVGIGNALRNFFKNRNRF